jgi:membrane-associated protease RseP (regulator of RpoE activity)
MSETSAQRAALRLGCAVIAIVAVSIALGALDILIVIACIVVIVMVHELGHLLAAKTGRMKVTEYFLGFGPRLWSIRRGETEYGVKAFPLGGYVKIPGMTNLEEVDPKDESRTYRAQPFRARLLVAVAGSAMHLLMAFVLLWSLLAFVGVTNSQKVEIQGTLPIAGHTSPAATAGLRTGDIVVSVDGRAIQGNFDTLTNVIRAKPGVALTVVVDRGGRRRTVTLIPADGRTTHRKDIVEPPGSGPFGVIGVSLGSPSEKVDPIHALGSTTVDLRHFGWVTLTGVSRLFSPSGLSSRFHQVVSAHAADQASSNGTRVESIVGAVGTGGQAVDAGIGATLVYLVFINLFLGIFNLVPMLPLDGGHVVIAVYERLRTGRRKVAYHADVAKLMPFTWLMLAFLAVLFTTSLLNDLLHPLPNPFG